LASIQIFNKISLLNLNLSLKHSLSVLLTQKEVMLSFHKYYEFFSLAITAILIVNGFWLNEAVEHFNKINQSTEQCLESLEEAVAPEKKYLPKKVGFSSTYLAQSSIKILTKLHPQPPTTLHKTSRPVLHRALLI